MNLELIQRIYYLEKEIERLESLETAVGVSGDSALTLIETQHLTAQAIALSFQNIPSTYTHLFFVGSIRSLRVDEADLCDVNFNNIAIPNAAFESYVSYAFGGTLNNADNTQRLTTGWFAGTLCPANMFTPFSFWVFDYADVSRNRQVKANSAYGKDKTAPDIEAVTQTACGHWKDTTTAVNRVDFASWARANNMAAGCHISLFGVN